MNHRAIIEEVLACRCTFQKTNTERPAFLTVGRVDAGRLYRYMKSAAICEVHQDVDTRATFLEFLEDITAGKIRIFGLTLQHDPAAKEIRVSAGALSFEI